MAGKMQHLLSFKLWRHNQPVSAGLCRQMFGYCLRRVIQTQKTFTKDPKFVVKLLVDSTGSWGNPEQLAVIPGKV